MTNEPVRDRQWVIDNVHPNMREGGAVAYVQREDVAAYAAFDAARAGRLSGDAPPPLPPASS